MAFTMQDASDIRKQWLAYGLKALIADFISCKHKSSESSGNNEADQLALWKKGVPSLGKMCMPYSGFFKAQQLLWTFRRHILTGFLYLGLGSTLRCQRNLTLWHHKDHVYRLCLGGVIWPYFSIRTLFVRRSSFIMKETWITRAQKFEMGKALAIVYGNRFYERKSLYSVQGRDRSREQ